MNGLDRPVALSTARPARAAGSGARYFTIVRRICLHLNDLVKSVAVQELSGAGKS